jgi:putative FmdB family regulatory protein
VPIYEYRCSSCGFQKEYLRKVSDPLLSSCPECGRESFQKMLTTAGFQLKGSGWYATDFKGNGAKPQKDKTEPAKAADPAKVAEPANATESAKVTDSAKAGPPASGAGAAAASTVAESGS